MAQKRKAKRKPGKRPAPPPPPAEVAPAEAAAEAARSLEVETSQQALVRIAQDAVLILRRELAFRGALSMLEPGHVRMSDCIALLRLTTELGAAALRGEDGKAQVASYDRLSPQERVQLAALMMKVDYS